MTKSSKIIITLLIIILIAVLGVGGYLINYFNTQKEENESIAIKENSANVANSEDVTENTSVNSNNSSNQSQQQNQNTNNSNSNKTSNTQQSVDISTDPGEMTAMSEGDYYSVPTLKYVSSLGYSMRYPSDSVSVSKNGGIDLYQYQRSQEVYYTVEFKPTSYNKIISDLNFKPTTSNNGFESSFTKHILNGYEASSLVQERNNVLESYTYINANNGTFIISVYYPSPFYDSGYAEGIGALIEQTIETFSINN